MKGIAYDTQNNISEPRIVKYIVDNQGPQQVKDLKFDKLIFSGKCPLGARAYCIISNKKSPHYRRKIKNNGVIFLFNDIFLFYSRSLRIV